MCFAIGPCHPPQRGRLGRYWWKISSSPLRLLGLGSSIHILLLALLLARAESLPLTTPGFALLPFGISTLLCTAFLMEYLPTWSRRSPVHPMRYTTVLLLISIGLLWQGLLLLSGAGISILAVTLLAAAWLLVLQNLRYYLFWMPASHRLRARIATLSCYLPPALFVLSLLSVGVNR